MTVLVLTADEKKAFTALPDALKEGWQVQDETTKFSDTAEEQMMRIKLMELKGFQFADLPLKSKNITPEQLEEWAKSLSLSKLSDDDMTEIFFALGPVSLSRIIVQLLELAQNDQDVEFVSALATIRHVLFS